MKKGPDFQGLFSLGINVIILFLNEEFKRAISGF